MFVDKQTEDSPRNAVETSDPETEESKKLNLLVALGHVLRSHALARAEQGLEEQFQSMALLLADFHRDHALDVPLEHFMARCISRSTRRRYRVLRRSGVDVENLVPPGERLMGGVTDPELLYQAFFVRRVRRALVGIRTVQSGDVGPSVA